MQPTPFIRTALGGHASAGDREVTAKAFILEQYPIASYELKALLPAPCRRSDVIAPFLPQPSKPTPPLRSDTTPPFWLFLLVQLSCTVHASSKPSRFPPPISNPVLSLTSWFTHSNSRRLPTPESTLSPKARKDQTRPLLWPHPPWLHPLPVEAVDIGGLVFLALPFTLQALFAG